MYLFPCRITSVDKNIIIRSMNTRYDGRLVVGPIHDYESYGPNTREHRQRVVTKKRGRGQVRICGSEKY
ncbi:hypothetical protein PM082_024101 [Marasmius tenuissimus]|nr:hypothetical protein PM082_024101 [Marasmius tenuissimus]